MSLRADGRGVIVPCAACGAANRLAFGALQQHTRCAACRADLEAPGAALEVGSAAVFDALTQGTPLPVVVDFWAPWCGPCRMMAPHLETLAARRRGTWLVVKVDTDAVPDLAQRFAIRSIPTLGVFAGGALVGRTSGAMGADQLDAFVTGALASRSA